MMPPPLLEPKSPKLSKLGAPSLTPVGFDGALHGDSVEVFIHGDVKVILEGEDAFLCGGLSDRSAVFAPLRTVAGELDVAVPCVGTNLAQWAKAFGTAIGWIELCGDGHLIADIDVGFDTGDGGGFGKGVGGAQGQCRGCECSDEANTVHSVPQRLKKKEKMV